MASPKTGLSFLPFSSVYFDFHQIIVPPCRRKASISNQDNFLKKFISLAKLYPTTCIKRGITYSGLFFIRFFHHAEDIFCKYLLIIRYCFFVFKKPINWIKTSYKNIFYQQKFYLAELIYLFTLCCVYFGLFNWYHNPNHRYR